MEKSCVHKNLTKEVFKMTDTKSIVDKLMLHWVTSNSEKLSETAFINDLVAGITPDLTENDVDDVFKDYIRVEFEDVIMKNYRSTIEENFIFYDSPMNVRISAPLLTKAVIEIPLDPKGICDTSDTYIELLYKEYPELTVFMELHKEIVKAIRLFVDFALWQGVKERNSHEISY